MSYEPTVWQTGDTVTAEKLNKLENGVKAVSEASEDLAGKMVAMYKIGISSAQNSTFIGNLEYSKYNEETGELTTLLDYDFSGTIGAIFQQHSTAEIPDALYLMDPVIWRPQIKNAKLVFIPNLDVPFSDYKFGGDYEITEVIENEDDSIPVVILTGTEFHVGVYID